jgi:signal recognition particle subunit SRP54
VFDQLTEKIQKVFKNLRGQGRLSEENIQEALGEVRLALLEADVNLTTVQKFLDRVKEKAVGREVSVALSPGQAMVKVVHDELLALLTPTDRNAARLKFASAPPTFILLAGLQGTGKTTTAAKLAVLLKKDGRKPGLVAADLVRPAAVDQLVALGQQADIPVFTPEKGETAPQVCVRAMKQALERGCHILILDTAGRLHVDEAMMNEVAEIQRLTKATNVLLVADAMTGQDAVNAAKAFHAKLPLTGLVLTKTDGDARGGALLSITDVTGIPVMYVGTGEKLDGLETFHPDRMASRILGMGDVLTLVEKAEAVAREKAEQRSMTRKSGEFTLDDVLDQLRQLMKMGSMNEILDLLPGDAQLKKQAAANAPDDKQLKRMEAILLSMTPKERHFPQLLDGARKKRIARGSGTRPEDINNLLKQYDMMRKMMKRGPLGMKLPNMPGGFRGMPGMR